MDVPLVGQQHGYDGQPSMRRDYCGNMRLHGEYACWYASACMVSYFFRTGPRLGLSTLWRPDLGLNLREFDFLARSEGLERLVEPLDGFTRDFIVETLETRGPIWAALVLPSGDSHVIVLTGLVANTLYYNDPWEPARKEIDFSVFRFDELFVKNRDEL
ncbi:papain-like cysteine protease family protein [Bradyrhizobium sp. USDA 3315]